MKNLTKQFSIYTALVFLVGCLFYFFAKPFIWGYDFSEDRWSQVNFWLTRYCTVNDGIEAYVLHIVLISMLGFVLMIRFFKYNFKPHFAYIGLLILFIRFVFTLPKIFRYADYLYFIKAHYWFILFYLLGALLFVYLIYQIAEKGSKIQQNILVFIWCIVSFIIPSDGFNKYDSSYILAPAHALNNEFDVKSVFIQYDLFVTLIGSLIMYLRLPLESYFWITKISFFVSALLLYKFSSRFFSVKKLAFYYIIYTVIMRYWGNIDDPSSVIGHSPLRLDFWVVIFLLAYRFGARHYSIGITLFLLAIFHRSFNLFYVISYIEFMVFMICCDHIFVPEVDFKKAKDTLKTYLPNLALVCLGFVVSYAIYGNLLAPEMKTYNDFKIGFWPVGFTSFFWPIILIIGYTAILLLKMKDEISRQYFETALLIIFLLLGNLFYFFGRSLEDNLLNLVDNWLLILFIAFDLCIRKFKTEELSSRWKFYVYKIPLLLIFSACMYYLLFIQKRIAGKLDYISKLEITNTDGEKKSVLELKKVMKNKDKVYFYDSDGTDFYYTYYGKYKPISYYQPHATWVLKKETYTFMQNLLLKNYDLVTTSKKAANDISNNLKFKNKYVYKNWIVITNNPTPKDLK